MLIGPGGLMPCILCATALIREIPSLTLLLEKSNNFDRVDIIMFFPDWNSHWNFLGAQFVAKQPINKLYK